MSLAVVTRVYRDTIALLSNKKIEFAIKWKKSQSFSSARKSSMNPAFFNSQFVDDPTRD